jgi:hypothetical protein
MSVRVVPTVSSYEGTASAWIFARVRVLLEALAARSIPLGLSLQIAVAVISQWALESRTGSREWNNAVGNIKASGTPDAPGRFGWHGDAMYLTNTHDGRQLYRSYATIRDGVEDWLQLMEGKVDEQSGHEPTRYAAAWRFLVENGDAMEWYRRLCAAGYTPPSDEVFAAYQSVLRRYQARLVR